MNNVLKYFRNHASEFVRAFLVAALLFLAAYLIESLPIRLAVFFALSLLFVVSRLFYPPGVQRDLQVLERDIQKMAEGNLAISPEIQPSSRETIRDFATSLVVLLGRLRQIVEKVKNVADSVTGTSQSIGQFSRVLLKSGQSQSQASQNASQAIAEINAAIKRIASAAESLNELGITASSAALQLTASIEEVTRNASQVGSFAKDTRASMENMVKGAGEIERACEMLIAASRETDLSMKNMNARIQEVTQRALESDELAERASEAARTGERVVADVQFGMEKIGEAFQNVSRVIGNLSHRSEQIGSILNVITQVADQTNLLSLNAAILSAQAGVHGKGFAVVADEIRKLSNRTAMSVQEIEKLISTVRVEIKEAVDLMEAGRARLQEGFERSGKASEALAEILTSATAARERVAAITESSRAQIEAEEQVQRSTETIKARLDQITRISREQTQVSNEVYSKAERMMDLLRNVEKGMEEQTHGAKEVSGIVEHLSGIIQNIHLATAEQSARSSQVVQSVESLTAAVQSSTATIRALNSTAVSLDQESFILSHELSHFQLPSPRTGGDLHLGIAARLSALDPALAQYVTIFEWVYNFFEGLVEFGEGTDIRPCLAERWEISEDGIIYTFKLRRGVRFHNGKELTAVDVRDSFQRALHPLTKSPGTWAFEMIEGAEEFRQGNAAEIIGVKVVDAGTLQIRLRESVPFFLGMIAQPFAYVVPSELAKRYGPLTDVIGTGPFKLDRFVPEERIEMSRFEGYHSPPIPYLQKVIASFGLSESEIAAGIQSGKFHYTSELQKHSLSEFINEPEWRPRLETNVQLYTAFLAMSCRNPPLDDVRVRQAIAYAIDRERIVRDIVGAEQAVIARTLLPPGLPGHDPNAIGYPYDPTRSRALLKAARVAEGTSLATWHGEAGSNLAVLAIVQENLRAVGLDLQIREVDPDTQNEAIDRGIVPMRMTRWLADYPDPDNFLYVTFHSKSSVYNLGFYNAEFDRLVQDARTLADMQERVRLYQRAERIWLQESPCVCLYHNRALVLRQDYVQGCVPHFTQPAVRLKKVWLSR